MNFLIHTGPGIGDIMQKLPMAKAIKQSYPDSNIDFLMKGSDSSLRLNNQIIESQDYVRNLYWYNVSSKLHSAGLLVRLRANRYDYGFVRDAGFLVEGGRPSFWVFRIMRWSGCRRVVGFVKDYSDVFVDVPEHAHYLERDRLTLEAVGIHSPLGGKTINTAKLDYSGLDELKGSERLIALSVGTNAYSWTENGKTIIYDVKSWGLERWMTLAEELVRHGYTVVLMGGRKERDEMTGMRVPDGVHDFVGRTTLKQSLALLSMCELAVGAEGGMMHCAAGLGIKTITIFGGSDYRIWTPAGGDIINLFLDCAPCYSTRRAAMCPRHKCLEGITVDMVLEKILNG